MSKKNLIERTLNNINFYKRELKDPNNDPYNVMKLLINEYGCLRGIMYTVTSRTYNNYVDQYQDIITELEPLLEREKYWETIRRNQIEKTRND